MTTYRCVICEREASYERGLPAFYPFCSPRCKMIDLGLWLREAYTIDHDHRRDDALAPSLPPADDPDG